MGCITLTNRVIYFIEGLLYTEEPVNQTSIVDRTEVGFFFPPPAAGEHCKEAVIISQRQSCPLLHRSFSGHFYFFEGGNEWVENSLYFIPDICISYSSNRIRKA